MAPCSLTYGHSLNVCSCVMAMVVIVFELRFNDQGATNNCRCGAMANLICYYYYHSVALPVLSGYTYISSKYCEHSQAKYVSYIN